jgi:hypothetical protein
MHEHPFEKALSLSIEDIELELCGFQDIAWAEFLLNPRRLRGSDFLMRWSQGVWSETRLIDAVNKHGAFYAIPYGPSGVAPSGNVREYELYFERLEAAGLGQIKRPDLLIFDANQKDAVNSLVSSFGGEAELPFIAESQLTQLLRMAKVAIECENSLWVAEKMPDYGSELKPMKRLDGKPGLKQNAVLPTVIMKEEDRLPLLRWQEDNKVSIHIWHVFFDRAYGLSLDKAQRLLDEKLIVPTVQIFQAPGGATTKKAIYKFYYQYAYQLGASIEKPALIPACIEDKNGHILPYVKFEGGQLILDDQAVRVLQELR